jgi:hypothetical protein
MYMWDAWSIGVSWHEGIYIYIYKYIYMYACIYSWMCLFICVCIHIYMCICICERFGVYWSQLIWRYIFVFITYALLTACVQRWSLDGNHFSCCYYSKGSSSYKCIHIYVYVYVGGLGCIGVSWYEGIYMCSLLIPYWFYVETYRENTFYETLLHAVIIL